MAQALTLGMTVSVGGVSLQEAKDLRFANETVYDLSGKPLNHLVLIGPETKGFWETMANPVKGADYSIYAVGATDKRSFFSFILTQDSFKSLLDARAKAGSYKRLLSAGGGSLYIENNSGRVWDVHSGKEVDTSQLSLLREGQRVLFEQRNKDGILDKIKDDWDKLSEEANKKALSQKAFLPTLSEATLPDGNLDVAKIVGALEVQRNASGVSAQYTNERSWCMGWFCAGMGYASVVRKNRVNQDIDESREYNPDNPQDYSDCVSGQKCKIANDISLADPLGNNQIINNFRVAPSDGYWGAWDFGLNGLAPLNNVGCGPLAITRVFHWYANERAGYGASNINFVNSGTAPSTSAGVAFAMYEPILLGNRSGQNVYQPAIARYTDTWWIQNSNQGFTRDTNMIPGANNWIRDRASTEGKNWEMRGSHKAFVNVVYAASAPTLIGLPISWVDFSQHTWRVRDIVRGKIGRDNEPVLAMYGPSVDQGHYAMSQAYIVHEGWFSATVFLWITRNKGDVQPGMFVNVTDMGSFFSGAYGMYRR